MIRSLVLLAAMTACAAFAGADTIYLRDKTVDGKATRDGDKVIIELTAGGRMEVDAKDVVYIHQPPSASQPATAGTQSVTVEIPLALIPAAASAPTGVVPVAAASTIDIEALTLPESMVFSTMRNLTMVQPGAQSFELRKQLETWRQAAHDRKRKVGPAWFLPRDFIHRRSAFDEALKEASDMAKKAKGKPNIKDLMLGVYAKLRLAAGGWLDPPIRNFLMATSDYQSASFLPAYTLYQQCHRDAPCVAAFAQGEALALVDLDRAGDALAAATDFMRMRDDSIEAYDLLKRVLAKVPGAEMRTPAFTAAKDLLALYQAPATSTPVSQKSVNSLMPGKPWNGRDDTTLPVPPYDRLTVRQAVAVPVADNLLLVDASCVTDALEVLVRIDNRTIVPATVKKAVVSSKAPVVPLAVLTLDSHSFTPLGRDEGPESVKDKDVTVWGLGMYPELGALREGKARCRILEDGAVRLSSALMPGEAAAPAVSDSGQLICFITGRTDPTVENGGDEKIISLAEISPLVKAAKGVSSAYVGTGRIKRIGAPTPVKGGTFVVYGLFAEKFTDK